jgi:hypothetical protein
MPPYQWWDPSKKDQIVFPEFRWVYEYARGVFMVPLSPWQRVQCLAVVGALAVKFVPRFARDILIAAEIVTTRILDRVLRADDLDETQLQPARAGR